MIRVTLHTGLGSHTDDGEGNDLDLGIVLETDAAYSPDVAEDLLRRAMQGWKFQHYTLNHDDDGEPDA